MPQVNHIHKTGPLRLFFLAYFKLLFIIWMRCCQLCTKPPDISSELSDLVLHVLHNARDTPIKRNLGFVQWRPVCNERNKIPFVNARMKTRNCSSQDFKHNPSCSSNVVSNKPGTGKAPVMKARNGDVLSQYSGVRSMIHLLGNTDVYSTRLFKSFCAVGTNKRLDLSLFWQAFNTC